MIIPNTLGMVIKLYNFIFFNELNDDKKELIQKNINKDLCLKSLKNTVLSSKKLLYNFLIKLQRLHSV